MNLSVNECIDWIIKWSAIIEPHVFTFSRPDIGSDLSQRFPLEWIAFIDDQSKQDQDQLLRNLLKLMHWADPSTTEELSNKSYWPQSMMNYFQGNAVLDSPAEAKKLTISRDLPGIYNYSNQTLREARMKRKKYHEVQMMSQVILEYAQKFGVEGIVDVGSGSGYLTVELSKKYPILAIDGDESQIRHSKQRREFSPESSHTITHVIERLNQKSLSDILDYYNLVEVSGRLEFQKCCKNGKKRRILLTSLHACGDLSSEIILNSFISCSWVACVFSIGCCYQMLSPTGFPLSPQVKRRTMAYDKKYPFNNLILNDELLIPSYRLLNCACQTMTGFSDDRIIGIWKAYAYRSLLELYLDPQKMEPLQPHLLIGTLNKHAFCKGFVHYALSALPNLESCISELQEFEKEHFKFFPTLLARIAFITTLRRFLGPVMESLLMLDRCLHLSLNDEFQVDLINVFKYEISPRNLGVVGWRRNS